VRDKDLNTCEGLFYFSDDYGDGVNGSDDDTERIVVNNTD
jgi:hypothetical protein